jgi:hypothetical protein
MSYLLEQILHGRHVRVPGPWAHKDRGDGVAVYWLPLAWHRDVCTLDHDIPSHVTNPWLSFCFKSDGDEVELLVEAPEGDSEHTDEETEHTESEESTGERSCHFHAGVE